MRRAFCEVARLSHESRIAPVIAETLWGRILDSKGIQWRHGHKALVLLEYLLEHGSEAVVAEVLDHARHVFRLTSFSGKQKVDAVKLRAVKMFTSGYDGGEKGRGERVRAQAQATFSLAHDTARLRFLRLGMSARVRKRVRSHTTRVGRERGNKLS